MEQPTVKEKLETFKIAMMISDHIGSDMENIKHWEEIADYILGWAKKEMIYKYECGNCGHRVSGFVVECPICKGRMFAVISENDLNTKL